MCRNISVLLDFATEKRFIRRLFKIYDRSVSVKVMLLNFNFWKNNTPQLETNFSRSTHHESQLDPSRERVVQQQSQSAGQAEAGNLHKTAFARRVLYFAEL